MNTARAHISRARAADIEEAAAAVRQGRRPPEATREADAKLALERAIRERDVLAGVVQRVEEEYGTFMERHQRELFADVLTARHAIALKLAENARAAMSNFARWADLARTVKDLAPPPSVETGPPGSDEPGLVRPTNAFVGFHGTQPSGIPRGTVEQVLGHLADMAPEEAGDDAAA